MTATTVVTFTATVFEDVDLFATLILENSRGDFGACNGRGADLGSCAFSDEENLVKGEYVPFVFTRVLVNDEDVALLHCELATGCDKCGLHGCRKVGANELTGGWQGELFFNLGLGVVPWPPGVNNPQN